MFGTLAVTSFESPPSLICTIFGTFFNDQFFIILECLECVPIRHVVMLLI